MLSRLFAAAVLVPALVVPIVHRPAAATPAPAKAAVWNIDKSHSSVNFQIRHFVSKVRGSFSDFKGTITADPESWETAQIDVVINSPSITTSNERRDADLRSANFFSVDTFPTITFKSTRIERKGDEAKIYGTLTMRGISKDVVLNGSFLGIQKSSQGADRVGFDASTTINRLDYGVKWNRAAEGGGVMLGDEVKIEINVEAIRAKTP